MKRDELGSCLTAKDNEEIKNMETIQEQMAAIEERDPVFYHRMGISLLMRELAKGIDPNAEETIDTLIQKSAGTFKEEKKQLCIEICRSLSDLLDALKKTGEDTSETQKTIDLIKVAGYWNTGKETPLS